MITLNEIAYNIQNLASGGKSSMELNVGIRQIKHWVHYNRAKIISENIDKGILSNHILWQDIPLDIFNYHNDGIRKWNDLWIAHLAGGLTPSISYIINQDDAYFVFISPKTSVGDFNGYWLAQSPLSFNSNNARDKRNTNQYGLTIPSYQRKGDFRNIGFAGFVIPEPLMLKNHTSIKDIALQRMVYLTEDADNGPGNLGGDSIATGGPQHDFIHIPMKSIDEASYSDFNRFSNTNKPHAMLTRSKLRSNIDSGYTILELNGLQTSPNYLEDKKAPSAAETCYWKYHGNLRAIFADPTQVKVPRVAPNHSFLQWDDASSPYPIPMEYVKDLIDRVVATEVSVISKTLSDEISDNADTAKIMQYGAQVQR